MPSEPEASPVDDRTAAAASIAAREAAHPRAPSGAASDRPLLDRLPIGVLVYRFDQLLYANRAFLDWTGYEDLHALTDAGGLDTLFVEGGLSPAGEITGQGRSITIAASQRRQAAGRRASVLPSLERRAGARPHAGRRRHRRRPQGRGILAVPPPTAKRASCGPFSTARATASS